MANNCLDCGGMGHTFRRAKLLIARDGTKLADMYKCKACSACHGTGVEPDNDPWLKPTLWGLALVACYFIWQFLR